MHFERALLDSQGYPGLQVAMIDGAQGMQAAGGFGYHGVAGGVDEAEQEFRSQVGHIAGDDQHPLRPTGRERRQQTAQGAAIGDQVGMSAASDDGDVARGLAHHVFHMGEQRAAVPGKQRLVTPHASAAASGQDKSSVLHEKIVAVLRSNTIAWFALALLAVLPLRGETAGARKLVVRADKRTGRLVTVAVPVAAKAIARKAPPAHIAQLVADAAKANGIDPLLVHSVIQVESNYNPYAISTAGARGLMQLMPGTARDLGVTDSFDARQNIEAGVKYLKKLKDQYQDDRLALAAYNAGPGSVQKYKTVPPYPETRDYVQRVGERYEDARKAAGIAPAVALQPEPPQQLPQVPAVLSDVPTEEKHARLEQFLDEYGRLHLRTVPE